MEVKEGIGREKKRGGIGLRGRKRGEGEGDKNSSKRIGRRWAQRWR